MKDIRDMGNKKVHGFLENSAKNFPDKLALVYKDRRYTYKELQEMIDAVGRFFVGNCSEQDIVGLYMENSDKWLQAYFGIMSAGCICNPIDLKSSDENVISQIKFARPKFLIISEKLTEKCKRLGLEKLTKIIVFDEVLKKGGEESGEGGRRESKNAKYSTVMFTSGTTGTQKAIRLLHEVVCNATSNILEYLKIRCDDVYYSVLPLSHSFGIGNVHTMFKAGGTVIVSDNTINLKKILQEMVEFKATFFAATPFTLKLITESFSEGLIKAGEFLRIICTNTGPVEHEVTKFIINKLKKTLFFTYYGLTEASRSTFHCFNLYPDYLDSVGRPAPYVGV